MKTKIENIDELKSVLSNKEKTVSSIEHFMQPFNLGRTLKNYSNIKQKGFSFTDVLVRLCTIQVLGMSIYQATREQISRLVLCGEKCVYYRLMENPLINWRGIYTRIVLRYYQIVADRSRCEGTKIIRCFVIDDTLLEKTGKCIEGITKVFDHVTRRSVLGLKMLVLGYWDGFNFVALDASLHNETGESGKGGLTAKEQRRQHKASRDKDSFGAKRKKELTQSKIDTAVQMLQRASGLGLCADYLVADSWFTCMEIIKVVLKLFKGKVHPLGMIVSNRHKFTYKGKPITTSGLIILLERKSSHYSRKFKCKYIEAMVDYEGIRFKIFLVRQGGKGKYKALLTTDTQLNFTQMMDIYKIRWSIEVFFKECKQYLMLGKSQSTNFDSQIASITITMIIHTVLTLEKRFNAYETMGELFKNSQKQLLELTLWKRLDTLIVAIFGLLLDLLEIDFEKLMERILNNNQYEQQYMAIIHSLQDMLLDKSVKISA